MSGHHHHQHRKRTARIFVALIALTIAAGHAAFAWFAQAQLNPWPFLKGILCGLSIAMLLLLVSIWRRQGWARYVAIVLLWAEMGLMLWAVMIAYADPSNLPKTPAQIAIGGMVLLLVANAVLISSRRIQHLVTPAGSGG